MEWKEVSIGDYVDLMQGFAINAKSKHYISHRRTNLHLLRIADMRDDTYSVYISDDIPSKFIANQKDIIYTRTGQVGLVFNNKYGVVHNNCFTVTPQNEDILCREYLLYALRDNYFYTSANNAASGSAQPDLSHSAFKQLKIKLPDIDSQRRIASILSSLDRKIELNNKINAQLEEMAQTLFKHWFVDFGPFKDGKFVESELGMIPEGWRVGMLGEIADIIGGSTPSKARSEYYTTNGIPWLTPKDLSVSNAKFMGRGEIDITETGYKSSSTKLMPKGTVLFSSRAPIGYISIAKNEICTNQGFKSAVPKYAGTAFLYCYLKDMTPEIESKATGSTFKEASGSLMKSLPVIIAPKKILEDFEEKLSPIFERQEYLEEECNKLASLRDTLLPKLMSGEINLEDYGGE